MKTIEVVCSGCNATVNKPLKEITRQRKNGNFNFYCNTECHGKSRLKLIREEYRNCDYCSNVFLADWRSDIKHCSEKCALADNNQYYSGHNRIYDPSNPNSLTKKIIGQANGLRKREMWKYVEIEALLNKNYLEHQFEYPLGNYVFDLALFWDRILVEFDGPDHKDSYQTLLDSYKESCAKIFNWRVVRIPTGTNHVISGNVILPYL